MALVAYGSSSESDISDEESETVDPTDDTQTKPAIPSATEQGQTNKVTAVPVTESTQKDDPTDFTISDEEDDIDIRVSSKTAGLHLPPPKSDTPTATVVDTSVTTSTKILRGLPAPRHGEKSHLQIAEDELEDIVKPKAYEKTQEPPSKRGRTTVKITIPDLPKDDSDDGENEMKSKKLKPSSGKSGLFSVLPAPKHVSVKETGRSLVPHTLTKKPPPTKPAMRPPVKKAAVTVLPKLPAANVEEMEDDDQDDDSDGNFFFLAKTDSETAEADRQALSASSFSVTSSVSTLEPVSRQIKAPDSGPKLTDSYRQTAVNLDASLEVGQSSTDAVDTQGPSNLEDEPLQFSKSHPAASGGGWGMQGVRNSDAVQGWPCDQQSYSPQQEAGGVDEIEGGIDVNKLSQDEQFLRMQGKKRRGKEEINIIDVRADDQLSSAELTKNLSEETPVATHSKKNKDGPTSQQKRKHQITYLAHKAKEREFDLKNQWAQNRVTRQQTQNKYGF